VVQLPAILFLMSLKDDASHAQDGQTVIAMPPRWGSSISN
jgi:hypothetical protein